MRALRYAYSKGEGSLARPADRPELAAAELVPLGEAVNMEEGEAVNMAGGHDPVAPVVPPWRAVFGGPYGCEHKFALACVLARVVATFCKTKLTHIFQI